MGSKETGPGCREREWTIADGSELIKIDWASIRMVHGLSPGLADVLGKHAALFKDKPGRMTTRTAHLSLKPGTRPVFRRPHTVPFAMKHQVGRELDRLEEQGILQRVKYSEWAAPIVLVHKRDGSIRICGN